MLNTVFIVIVGSIVFNIKTSFMFITKYVYKTTDSFKNDLEV
jgi:hypothetical protein